MSTLIDDVLPVISAGWGLVQASGVTKHSVRVVRRTWSGGESGNGVPTDSPILDITPNPEKKETRDGIRLGPIIPAHVGGGYTIAQLIPADAPGEEYFYEVTLDGGEPERYAIVGIDDSESFQYFVELIPLSLAGPE